MPFGSSRCVGIAFGRDAAAAVLLQTGRRGRSEVVAEARTELPPDTWQSDGAPLGDTFLTLARRLGRDARRADTTTAVALPDPLATEEELHFRDVPETPGEVAELIRWRIARDLRRPAESVACTFLPTGEADGHGFLVRVLPAARVASVRHAVRAAGLRLARLETVSRFGTDDGAGPSGGAAARILVTTDWWSIGFSRGGTGPERVYADWLSAPDAPDALRQIARTLKSLLLAAGASELRVTVEAPDSAAEAVAETIDAALGGAARIELAPLRPLEQQARAVALDG